MDTHQCPICHNTAGQTRNIGELTVRTCRDCGHGWLAAAADNTHFEGEHYRDWRTANRALLRERGQRYIRDLLDTTGSVPQSAVEIGCATGDTIAALAEAGAKCWAADTADAAIQVARDWYPDVTFTLGELPDPDRKVDVALMMHVIEHVPDPVSTLRHIRDLAEPGATLYLRTPNFASAPARALRWAWPDYMADHVHYFTPESLRRAVAAAGWTPGRQFTASNAWPWLGGVKRVVRRTRPGLSAGGHGAPPSARQMRVLTVADRAAAPLLRVESRSGRGGELVQFATA